MAYKGFEMAYKLLGSIYATSSRFSHSIKNWRKCSHFNGLSCILCEVNQNACKLLKIQAFTLLFVLGSMGNLLADVDLSIIATIESNNRPNVCSYKGCKYGRGLHQISEITLTEFNQFNRTSYSPSDLFNPEINTFIADWYLNKRIPQMLRHYGLSLTLNNILICYNFGIGNLKNNKPLPPETLGYIQKYRGLAHG